ncbi:MAG: smalltalk protein [Bacteroidaceae bacterium]|nr:smalltalk protein [Bacteroidaceae bacterium]
MKKETWKTILQIIGYVIAAILGGAGASCLL